MPGYGSGAHAWTSHPIFFLIFSFIKSAHLLLTLSRNNHKAWLFYLFFFLGKRNQRILALDKESERHWKVIQMLFKAFPICASLHSLKHACRTGIAGMVWQPHTRHESTKLSFIRRRQSRLKIWWDLFPSLNLFLGFWLTAQDWRNLSKMKIQIVCLLCHSTWCSQCFSWPFGDEGSLCKVQPMNTVW